MRRSVGVLSAAALACLAVGLLAAPHQERANALLMRFFRDLSRAKARARLREQGAQAGLVPILLGREEPLVVQEPPPDALLFTLEELAQFDGSTPGLPLYIAVQGRVYDVSEGAQFYGPGRSYNKLLGIDATYAFGTGCLRTECLTQSSALGLSKEQRKEVHRWVELYEHSDRYRLVGVLQDDPVAKALERELFARSVLEMEEQQQEQEDPVQREVDRLALARKLSVKADEYRKDGEFDEAEALWGTALMKLGEQGSPAHHQARIEVLGKIAAMVHHQQQDYKLAVDKYAEVIESTSEATDAPVRARALTNQAICYHISGDTQQAVHVLNKALGVYKDDLGLSLREDPAEQATSSSVQLRLSHAEALFYLVSITQSSGQVATSSLLEELRTILEHIGEILAAPGAEQSGRERLQDLKRRMLQLSHSPAEHGK